MPGQRKPSASLVVYVRYGRDGSTVLGRHHLIYLIPARSQLMSAARFRELIATAPEPDARFLGDVRHARASVEPPEDAWRS